MMNIISIFLFSVCIWPQNCKEIGIFDKRGYDYFPQQGEEVYVPQQGQGYSSQHGEDQYVPLQGQESSSQHGEDQFVPLQSEDYGGKRPSPDDFPQNDDGFTIELGIIADHTVFALALQKSGQDNSKAEELIRTKIKAQVVKINKVYQTLNPPVSVKLAKLLIWKKAPVPVPADPIGLLEYWKAVTQHVGAFYLGVDVIGFGHAPGFAKSPGRAFNGLSCDGSFVFHEDLEIDKSYATSHELGHIMGLCHVNELKLIQQNERVCLEFQNVPEAMACEKTDHTIMSSFATANVDDALKFSSCAQAMWKIQQKVMDERFGAKNCFRMTNQRDFTASKPIAEQDCKASNEMFISNRCFVLTKEADYNTTVKTCGTETLRMDTLQFLPQNIQDKLGPQLPRTKLWRVGNADFERSFCPVYIMTDGPSFVTGWRASCLFHRKGLCEKINK